MLLKIFLPTTLVTTISLCIVIENKKQIYYDIRRQKTLQISRQNQWYFFYTKLKHEQMSI